MLCSRARRALGCWCVVANQNGHAFVPIHAVQVVDARLRHADHHIKHLPWIISAVMDSKLNSLRQDLGFTPKTPGASILNGQFQPPDSWYNGNSFRGSGATEAAGKNLKQRVPAQMALPTPTLSSLHGELGTQQTSGTVPNGDRAEFGSLHDSGRSAAGAPAPAPPTCPAPAPPSC